MTVNNSPDPFSEMMSHEADAELVETLEKESMPADVKELMEAHKLSNEDYQCALIEIQDQSENIELKNSDSLENHINVYNRTYPNTTYIAKNFGPGRYALVFTWRAKDPDTKKLIPYSARVAVSISEKYRDAYEEYQYEKRLERKRRDQERIRKLNEQRELDDALSGKSNKEIDKAEIGKSYVQEISQAAQMLGLSNKSTDWGSILKSLAPVALPLFTMMSEQRKANEDRFNNMMMMMIQNQNENSNRMMETVTKIQAPSTGVDYMKDVKDMIFSAMDIKSAISGDKESVVDKVFKLVEGVAPIIVQMASQPIERREQMPPYQMAQQYVSADPEFQKVKDDPEMLKSFVNRLDDRFGPESTDEILLVGNLKRPADTMENYQKYSENSGAEETTTSKES